MQKNIDDLYNYVHDLLPKEEFLQKIKEKKQQFDDLFDDQTVALLLVDEMERNPSVHTKIAELHAGMEATVYGKIISIGDIRTFSRKNGTIGRVLHLDFTDGQGTCGLTLWDRDVEMVTNGTITTGSHIKIINGYVKSSGRGLEIHVGRWSILEVEPEAMPQITIPERIPTNEIKGTISKIAPTRPFFKEDGDFGFVTTLSLHTSKGLKEFVVWNEKVKELQRYKTGDSIVIHAVEKKERNGAIEYHINGNSLLEKT